MYGRGVVRTLLKGHFGRRGLRRRDPPTTSRFEENPKNVENLKGGAHTSGMMYRGPQGTPGRAEGRAGALPPNYSDFLPFL